MLASESGHVDEDSVLNDGTKMGLFATSSRKIGISYGEIVLQRLHLTS
jgi:hypothetical protein